MAHFMRFEIYWHRYLLCPKDAYFEYGRALVLVLCGSTWMLMGLILMLWVSLLDTFFGSFTSSNSMFIRFSILFSVIRCNTGFIWWAAEVIVGRNTSCVLIIYCENLQSSSMISRYIEQTESLLFEKFSPINKQSS